MNPNLTLLLDGEQLRRLDDQRRRDLAAQWGRPPVPRTLNGARPLSRWLSGRLSGRRRAPVADAC